MWSHFALPSFKVKETPPSSPKGPKPCEVCTSLSSIDGVGHVGQSVPVFEASREAGCLDCLLVLDAVEEYRRGWLERHRDDGTIQLRKLSRVVSVEISPIVDKTTGKSGRFSIWQHEGRLISLKPLQIEMLRQG